MIMIFGIPGPLLFGQLLLGLINGAFYAMLSLGLAVIFGMLNIINFAHGALFMMGAFASWMLLNYVGIGYFPALILAPLLVGHLRHHPGKDHHQPAVQAGSSVRPAADLRPVAGDRGPVPQRLWQFRHAVPHPGRAAGRDQPRLHVHAELPRLGGAGGAGGLPRRPGRSSRRPRWAPRCGRRPRMRRWCRRSASTCRG